MIIIKETDVHAKGGIVKGSRSVQFFGNITSEWARDGKKHEELRSRLRQQFEKQLPDIVKRLAETRSFISLEDTEFSDLLKEAMQAYSNGYWRSVVALIGVAGESFTEKLYCDIPDIVLDENVRITRHELLGKDDNVRENIKIAALLVYKKINKPIFDKLRRIKALRDSCVHHQLRKKPHNFHAEAKEAFNSFTEITVWYTQQIHSTINAETIVIEKAD